MRVVEGAVVCFKYGILLLVPYVLTVYVYRAYFHPLKNYPGPRIARLSDAYGGWYSARRKLHLQTHEDHLKYGSIMRHGPNKLAFNTVTALHDIYLNENFYKSQAYRAGDLGPSSNVFTTIDKSLHRIKRRIVGPAVSERSLRTFEPTMTIQIEIFLRQILSTCQESPGAAINMTERCKWLGWDIIGNLAFGYDLDLQKSNRHRYLTRAMAIAGWRLNTYFQFPMLQYLQLEILFYLIAVVQGRSLLRTITKMIKSRLTKEKHAENDLYSYMIDKVGAVEGDKVALEEIWIEAVSFVGAGADTTSSAMTSTFFYLAKNPTWKKKLLKEIEETFTSSADIKIGPQLANCSVLRACIDEALRMSPPVAGVLWREPSPDGTSSLVVDDCVIPPGTQVGVSAYAIHYNENYFPRPFIYNPERWLHGDETSDMNLSMREAFVPFSIGSRGCLGKAMAYQELSLTIAKTMWYFDFSIADKSASTGDQFILQDIFTSTHDGPHLNFEPRQGHYKEL